MQDGHNVVQLNTLPPDTMVAAARFLRSVAMWDALERGNQAILERLQPVESL
jgi:hypothetical protein